MTTANPSKYNGSASNAIPSSIENMENEIQRLQSLNKELEAALRDMRDACKGEPAMNHQKYDALGIRVNNLLARAESATPAKFDFAAHDAAFVEWWSREGSGFHPAAIEDREEFTRRIANLAWIISANAARKQEAAR